MRPTLYATIFAAVAGSVYPAAVIPQYSQNAVSKRGIDGLPNDGLRTNCINIGFLPSEGDSASPRYTMAQINEKLGAKASTYGWYAQIKDSTFDGSQLLAIMDDVKASGAVFVASVMPSVNFNQVSTDVAKQVSTAMRNFTDNGIEVWLRYAHEMNWYVSDGTYYGTAQDFITSWKNIYNANCKGNEKVKCFWSPNQADNIKDLEQWWPGPEFVDIVGIDCYPRSGDDVTGTALFERFYGKFYNTFSAPNNIPFAIGETGAGPGQKEDWLKSLVTQDRTKYPNYISMSWFEFDKEADFRIVMTDDATLQKAKQILLADGNESCVVAQPSSSGSVPVTPSSTSAPTSSPSCDWGCWGWDCSASVPCQEPWTCKGGYCK